MNSKVLIVDDEQNVLNAMKRKLGEKYKISLADNGEKGLELLKKNGPFAVIISDYMMPGMDGVDFLSRVEEVEPAVKKIMLTGYPDMQMAINSINKGRIFSFLTKPCTTEMIEDAVQKGIEEYNQDLNEEQEGQAKALNTLIQLQEMKDSYTADHQLRVSDIVASIALELGIEGSMYEEIMMAAAIHEVGKLFVPDEILVKPGKLEDYEWNAIQQHPTKGYDVLREYYTDNDIPTIVKQHHERIDGSGYPEGLKGQEIHMGAKIISVADVFEAMSSHRPYRPSLGEDAAVQEITEKMGVLYDIEVVMAFLSYYHREYQSETE